MALINYFGLKCHALGIKEHVHLGMTPAEQLTAMRDGMDELLNMVFKLSEAIGDIKSAKRWVPSDVKGFNGDTKETIQDYLAAAET